MNTESIISVMHLDGFIMLKVTVENNLKPIKLYTGVFLRPLPNQEGNKLGSMSGTRANSATWRRELSSILFYFTFFARQGAEGNSRHSDRNISLFPSW